MPSEVFARGLAADLCEQFVLSASVEVPDGWVARRLGGWHLAHHPTLPVITILDPGVRDSGVDDRGASPVGWLLGYPITPEGRLLGDGATVTLFGDPADLADELGGRFLVIIAHDEHPAIHPDAIGSYSSVYCPSLRIAASTPALIPYESTTTDRHELIRQLGIPWIAGTFPFGMTARHGVERLLPNHHLDLLTWSMVRHGPRRRYERGELSVEETASRIATIVRRQIDAVMDHIPCYLPLTAGNDSRLLLACARHRRDELALYTADIADLGGATDAATAATIARRFGLHHQRISMVRPTTADRARWLHRTGCTVGEPRGLDATTTYRTLDRSRARLNGQIGDFARNVYRLPADREDTRLTIERLAVQAASHHDVDYRASIRPGKIRFSLSPEVLGYVEQWMHGVDETDALRVLDLVYVEKVLAAWAGVWVYAEYFGPGFTVFPMCHSDVIALIMGLPDDVRRKEDFNRIVIAQEWPELLDVPVNRPTTRTALRQRRRAIVRRVRRSTNGPANGAR
jgi:hypothetical protein